MKKSILLSFLFLSIFCFAQNRSGIVEYSIADVNVPLKEGNPGNDAVINIIKAAKSQTFELKFNNAVSSFDLKEVLIDEQDESTQLLAKIAYTTSDAFFIDQSSKTLLKKTDTNILIKENLENYEWKITTESKMIDQYLCYKAECSESFTSRTGEKKTRLITAWFAPSLPYSFGPKEFHGLPGLILELNQSYTTFLATKIELSDKEIKIGFPKGKTITQEEYERKVMSGN